MKWHCWSFGIFPIQPIQWRKDDYLYVCVCYCIYTAEEERPGTEHRQSNCKMDLVYVVLSYRPFSIQCIAWAPFVSSAIFIVISSNGIDLTLFANSSSHIQFHNIRFPFCLMQRSTLYCTVLYYAVLYICIFPFQWPQKICLLHSYIECRSEFFSALKYLSVHCGCLHDDVCCCVVIQLVQCSNTQHHQAPKNTHVGQHQKPIYSAKIVCVQFPHFAYRYKLKWLLWFVPRDAENS